MKKKEVKKNPRCKECKKETEPVGCCYIEPNHQLMYECPKCQARIYRNIVYTTKPQ